MTTKPKKKKPIPGRPPTAEDHVARVLKSAIRSARGRGESLSSIARRSGVPQPCVSRMVSGARRGVSLSNAKKLAAALGVDLGGIL